MSLFAGGFPENLRSLFCDVTLTNGNNSYEAHKIILCFSSKFFDRMFSSDNWSEKHQRVIELKYPDPRNVFPDIMNFMYNGKLTLTWDRIIPLLVHADYYGIEELSKQCHSYIKAHLKRKTVLSLLRDAIEFRQQEIVDRCMKLVVSNFLHMYECDFTWMDPNTFLNLLTHKQLAVREEWPLYKTITKYIDANESQLDPEIIVKIMESVRFRWMAYEQLMSVRNDPRVPRHLLIEAIMAKLRDIETKVPIPKNKIQNIRLQPRVSCGIEFEYNPKQPKYGILSRLGTCFNKHKWKNPYSQGIVKVTASSIERGHEKYLLDPQENELWTCDVPASWFCIDLQQWSVLPSSYTLRHGGNYVADSLRNWDFQGSVDGVNWYVLRRHYKDDSLNGKFSMCTWPIKLDQENQRPYRLFRIIQTGHNSSNHNFLVLSFFELYGEIWETEEAKLEFPVVNNSG